MPTVINELTLEPKAAPPPETAPGGAPTKSTAAMEREFEALRRWEHERMLRMWAH